MVRPAGDANDADRPGGRPALAMAVCGHAGMREAGLSVELLETRHVRDAFKAMPVKTDRNDARGIAQLMRLGWFRSVHCKSLPAQELRAVLTGRKLLQGKRHDVEMSLRGILRGFGLKVGPTTARGFEGRIRGLVDGHPTLAGVADALLLARETLSEQLALQLHFMVGSESMGNHDSGFDEWWRVC
jgi:transposase